MVRYYGSYFLNISLLKSYPVGTWEDGTSDTESPPSNITRISRALRQYAKVERNGVSMMVPQIVYYQKGVGTGVVDQYIGGE